MRVPTHIADREVSKTQSENMPCVSLPARNLERFTVFFFIYFFLPLTSKSIYSLVRAKGQSKNMANTLMGYV